MLCDLFPLTSAFCPRAVALAVSQSLDCMGTTGQMYAQAQRLSHPGRPVGRALSFYQALGGTSANMPVHAHRNQPAVVYLFVCSKRGAPFSKNRVSVSKQCPGSSEKKPTSGPFLFLLQTTGRTVMDTNWIGVVKLQRHVSFRFSCRFRAAVNLTSTNRVLSVPSKSVAGI
jgi:hypothetical protein